MKRRQALQKVALLMGTAVSAPTLLATLQGCKKTAESGGSSFEFSQSQQEILDDLTEIIIPKTTTAGAKEAGVGEFIQTMLRDCYSEAQQKSFVQGIEKAASLAKEKNVDMSGGDTNAKASILTEMKALSDQEVKKGEEKAKQIDAESGLEKKAVGEKPVVPFYKLLKELTLFGYFTSEKGAKENLEYVPIPGKFEGCISITPDQKAYAI